MYKVKKVRPPPLMPIRVKSRTTEYLCRKAKPKKFLNIQVAKLDIHTSYEGSICILQIFLKTVFGPRVESASSQYCVSTKNELPVQVYKVSLLYIV